jgi:hypothetical protein
MECWEKFKETQLPLKEAFYIELNKYDILDDYYHQALYVWKAFGLRNTGDYHDYYLRTDVLHFFEVLLSL